MTLKGQSTTLTFIGDRCANEKARTKPGLPFSSAGQKSAGDCRLDYFATVKAMVVVWVVVPLVPVMVMVYVPVLAVLATLKVRSDVPEPVMDVGL